MGGRHTLIFLQWERQHEAVKRLMPGNGRDIYDDPPLHLYTVFAFASVDPAALAGSEGRQEVGLPHLAHDDMPLPQLVPVEVLPVVESDAAGAEVVQHLVDLRIELSGISVELIISEAPT
jgi:hypothetical protein